MSHKDANEVARLRDELNREREAHARALKVHDGSHQTLLKLLEDLTASRTKIEQAQHEWNATFDAMLDPIFLHDKNNRVVRANRAYAARAGLPFREILGHPYWEVFPKVGGPLKACCRYMANALEEEASEEELRLESGQVILSRSFPVRDAQGAWLYGVHLLQDVTEKYLTERALRESEEKFHCITAAAKDAILMMDNDGRVAFWNTAAERLFGYSAQEALGRELHLLLAPERYHADYRKSFAHFRDTGEGPIIGKVRELVARRKDGTEFPIELSVSALRYKNLWHAVGILRDITARKHAETELRLFRTLLDNSNDAIEVIDPDTLRFLDVNEKECRDLGYSREELLSMTVLDIDPTFDPASMKIIDEQVAKSGFALFERTHRRRDGSSFPVEISLKFIEIEGKGYVLSIARDIAARKQAEAALKESELKFRTIFEGVFDGILVADPDTRRFLIGNRRIGEMLGYTWGELSSLRLDDLHPPEALPHAIEEFGHQSRGETSLSTDLPLKRKDGSVFYADISSTPIVLGDKICLLGLIRDVTERKHTADKLAENEHLRRSLLDTLTQRVFYKDRDLNYIACNTAYAGDLHLTPDAVVGKSDLDFFPADLANRYRNDDREVMKNGQTKEVEEPYLQDGKECWVHTVKTPMRDPAGNVTGVLGIFWDVTEQRRSKASLAEAQRIAHLGSWNLELVANRLAWSDEIYRIFEIDPTEFGASYEAFLSFVHPDDRDAVHHAFNEHIHRRTPYDIVHRLLLRDGRVKYVRERGETIYDGDRPLRTLGTVQDVTERQLAEIALSKVLRALKTLSAGNAALVRATDEQSLVQEMCRVIVEVGGYRMAMVAYAGQDDAKTLRPVAYAGFEEGYAALANLSWSADHERGRGPGGIAVRTGRPYIARDIPTDPTFAPWRDEALKRGYRSVIALPLMDDDQAFGVLGIYSGESGAFDHDEEDILEEMAGDLAFGILTLQTRHERNRLQEEHLRSADRLKQTLVDTIRAIALTVEKRDPYTAGHQNRVAELSVAIGRELGLGAERLEGLRLGASIHDIGKIYIPAEILNRPGRLSAPEFEIIKSHPEVGYDIIKDVKFPWPVGEMILQHHERLDGSGYPRGLKGEGILLEARILAVADVVEAMSAHRPYRPARGVEEALAEIERHRGVWYDPEIADACLRIIKEGRFRFGGT